MIRFYAPAFVLCAGLAQADVLGLNDYDALFAANADAIEELANGAEAIALEGGIFVSRQDGDVVTLDQSEGGAVGCFVSILAQVDSYVATCDVTLEADKAARLERFRTSALTFYGQNTSPQATPEAVRTSYDALRDASPYNSGDFCDAEGNIAAFIPSFLGDSTDEVVDQMIAVPRLPASNPCF
ncbi:hypothetical protein [Yoonia sp. 208BN28-4]|uniref:hypothetical protein n=1 Tax=Yoonia sp. 208BN28-4 TaxID=3126505 RepID=UPI00309D0F74